MRKLSGGNHQWAPSLSPTAVGKDTKLDASVGTASISPCRFSHSVILNVPSLASEWDFVSIVYQNADF
jgi:hypothetical protein